MSYVDKNLISGEIVTYRGKLHWNIFLLPGLLTFIFAMTSIVMMSGDVPNSASRSADRHMLTYLMIAWLILRVLTYWTSEFVVTNKRVIIKVGFIRRKSLEMLNAKIESLGVDQGLFGRAMNFGALIVSGTGGTRSLFKNIADPMKFRKAFYEELEKVTTGSKAS